MDDKLKQFLIDLYVIGQEMQKKLPDKNSTNNFKKGSGPISPNYQAR